MDENQGNEQPSTRDRKGEGPFQIVVAILIAVVSVASAVVVWRASMAGSAASNADRRGLVTTVKHEAAHANNVELLYEEATYASRHDSYQARVDALLASESPAARSEAEWVNQVVVNLAIFTPLADDPGYRNADGSLDLEGRLEDLRAADADLRDLDAQHEFDAADRLYLEAQILASAIVVFALALFFLTLAELVQHRRIRLGLAVIGGLVFLIGLVGVLGVELYFVVSRLIAA